jgi:hypothetical protein
MPLDKPLNLKAVVSLLAFCVTSNLPFYHLIENKFHLMAY